MTALIRTLIALLLISVSSPAADPPAPLGKLLAKHYPAMGNTETAIVLVYLKDKGPRGRMELYTAAELLSGKSISRRAKVMRRADVLTPEDLPLEASYVAQVSGLVTKTRHELKWFNAISAEATKPQIDGLRELPFVREIELVGRWHSTPEPEGIEKTPAGATPDIPSATQAHLLDYGLSITQNALSRVPEVHDRGIFGEGVTIAVFDNGFRLLTHESFASMNIIAQYDFVDHKVSVVPDNPALGFGSHGVNTLSTIGGFTEGELIGPAFRADYILGRTENDSSETPVEEDNWAAAIEWADSIGVDVTSTSLGYLDYQAPYASWTWEDMDGNTTLITRAADHAVSLGIVVVNSAGNEGTNNLHNTLIAPADGDSVITVGAVTSSGVRTSFSSMGPTTDVPGRIKPDVMAMGSGVRVASSSVTTGYGYSSGTSFSCPLTAGIAALLLSANPALNPIQVRDALRNTADNAATPSNFDGWGVVDADSAVRYWGIVPMAVISGTVYLDVNGNGAPDGGEAGLSAESVVIAGPTPDTLVTGPGGSFQSGDLAPGAYTLSVSLSPGWIVTTPPGSLGASLLHRDTLTGFSIGIVRTGTLGGTVFNDLNENGVKDGAEAGLAGWTVRLAGPVSDSAVTDGAGEWSLTDLPPGAYTVWQEQGAGWLQSRPAAYGNYDVVVTDGLDTAGLDFGNVFHDAGVFPVGAGWNLLSLPVEMPLPLADSVYPNAVSPVSLYSNGYYSADTLPNGKGYWVKFPTPQNVLLLGLDRTLDTAEVAAGWNLVGTLSVPVTANSVVQLPDSIVVTPFYEYTALGYLAVSPDSALLPHKGYWVKCSQAGGLVLDAGAAAGFSPEVWVGKFYQGGVQCDAEFYQPPDTRELLEDAGIGVSGVEEEEYAVCAACGCPDYAGVRYALISSADLGKAEDLGFLRADPPSMRGDGR